MHAPVFTAIADVYDTIHQDVPHDAWLDFALAHARSRGFTAGAVLDVGCGTGLLTARLHVLGYPVVGVDPATDMLAVARNRLPAVTFLAADARVDDLAGRYALALAVFDVVNYLHDDGDLERLARNVRRHLHPGGVFAFDANTTAGLTDPWGESIVEGWAGEIHYRFEHAWDAANRRATLLTTFDTPNGPRSELHVERPVDPADIRAALAAAGFVDVRVVTHPDGDDADDDDPRVWAFATAP
jgi:predicted TPR repeat methyltransferase